MSRAYSAAWRTASASPASDRLLVTARPWRFAHRDPDMRDRVLVRHVLVDAVVGEPGQRLLGGGQVDVAVPVRRTVPQRFPQQRPYPFLSQHRGSSRPQRITPTRTLRNRDGLAPWLV